MEALSDTHLLVWEIGVTLHTAQQVEKQVEKHLDAWISAVLGLCMWCCLCKGYFATKLPINADVRETLRATQAVTLDITMKALHTTDKLRLALSPSTTLQMFAR
jgi:PIN domain nuclease of toxin-antitoxin system